MCFIYRNTISHTPLQLTSFKQQIHVLPRSHLFRLRTAEIVLDGNNIYKLHISNGELNPCNIHLDTIIKQCTCKDIWLQQCLPKNDSKCSKNIQVLCRIHGQLISISIMTKKDHGYRISDSNFNF